MQPLFDNDTEWSKYKEVLLSWMGTPYRHLTMCKGRGADCTLFIAAALKEAGYLLRIVYEYYSHDWHIHTEDEFVIDSWAEHMTNHFKTGLTTKELSGSDGMDTFIRGDVVGFSTSKAGVSNHCGILLGDGSMIHSINQRGVSLMDFGNYWKKRFTIGFRIVVK